MGSVRDDSVAAGGDLALICQSAAARREAVAAIGAEIDRGALNLAQAVRRHRLARGRIGAAGPRPDLSVIGCIEHGRSPTPWPGTRPSDEGSAPVHRVCRRAMLPAMSGSTLGRRAFAGLIAKALVAAGALGIARPDAVLGRARNPKVFTGEDTFERLMTLAREGAWSERPLGERIGAIGMALRQTPYVDATLELYEDREVCSVNLRGLDCWTFFESALAFARMLRRGGRTPEALLAEVTFTRYRAGQVTNYASRLHYLSDWFVDNERKGVVRLITAELPGAARFTKRVSFMSTHPGAYRQLRASPDLVRRIARVEAEINARETEYLPKDKVAGAEPQLTTGDIVGVTTTIDGLDCAHAGLCYRNEGVLKLLHGSTARKAVILDEQLATYLARVSTHTGIMVARPLEVT